jgi:hypothetical protein
VFNGHGVFIFQVEEVVEKGLGHSNVNVLKTTKLCILNVWRDKFER